MAYLYFMLNVILPDNHSASIGNTPQINYWERVQMPISYQYHIKNALLTMLCEYSTRSFFLHVGENRWHLFKIIKTPYCRSVAICNRLSLTLSLSLSLCLSLSLSDAQTYIYIYIYIYSNKWIYIFFYIYLITWLLIYDNWFHAVFIRRLSAKWFFLRGDCRIKSAWNKWSQVSIPVIKCI